MSKAAIIWLVIAGVLTVVGAAIFILAMSAHNWDFSNLQTDTYEKNVLKPEGEFENISINVHTTKTTLLPSEDGTLKIECFEAEKMKHTASVTGDTLFIEVEDNRKWYDHIGIITGSPAVTVYLPDDIYSSLSVETNTGDVTVSKELSFSSVEIVGDTSDVKCLSKITKKLEIETDTGSINVENAECEKISLLTDTGNITVKKSSTEGDIKIETDTGKTKLSGVFCKDFFAESNTGDLILESVIASGKISVETDTGDVVFESSDADSLFIETSTGDVTGTLLTEKVFVIDTSTGDISVPKTTNGGKCMITTSTGDIDIDIAA